MARLLSEEPWLLRNRSEKAAAPQPVANKEHRASCGPDSMCTLGGSSQRPEGRPRHRPQLDSTFGVALALGMQEQQLGNTALHWAAANGQGQAVGWLLQQHGVEVDGRNHGGGAPRHSA